MGERDQSPRGINEPAPAPQRQPSALEAGAALREALRAAHDALRAAGVPYASVGLTSIAPGEDGVRLVITFDAPGQRPIAREALERLGAQDFSDHEAPGVAKNALAFRAPALISTEHITALLAKSHASLIASSVIEMVLERYGIPTEDIGIYRSQDDEFWGVRLTNPADEAAALTFLAAKTKAFAIAPLELPTMGRVILFKVPDGALTGGFLSDDEASAEDDEDDEDDEDGAAIGELAPIPDKIAWLAAEHRDHGIAPRRVDVRRCHRGHAHAICSYADAADRLAGRALLERLGAVGFDNRDAGEVGFVLLCVLRSRASEAPPPVRN